MAASSGRQQQQQQQQKQTASKSMGRTHLLGSSSFEQHREQQPAPAIRRKSTQANQLAMERSESQSEAPAAEQQHADVVFQRLMAFEAFRRLQPAVIKTLCSYAFVERLDKNVTVFRLGDDAINWYALLEGSVDVRVGQQLGNSNSNSNSNELKEADYCQNASPDHSHLSHWPATFAASSATWAHHLFRQRRASYKVTRSQAAPIGRASSFKRLGQKLYQSLATSNQQQQQHELTRCKSHPNFNQQDQVTLCTLGVGTTFGASAAPGRVHNVSVVTNEECTLLRVRRADFQTIFQDQSQLVASLTSDHVAGGSVDSLPFCSLTAFNKLDSIGQEAPLPPPPPTTTTLEDKYFARADDQQQQQPTASEPNERQPDEKQQEDELATAAAAADDDDEQDELGASSPNELMRVGWILRTLMLADQRTNVIRSQRWFQPKSDQQPVQEKQPATVQAASRSASAGRKVANYVASSLMRAGAGGGSSCSLGNTQEQPRLGVQLELSHSMSGHEMVDWLLQLGRTNTNATRFVASRLQALSVWQVLLEHGVLVPVGGVALKWAGGQEPAAQPQDSRANKLERLFSDHKQAIYRFCFDQQQQANHVARSQAPETIEPQQLALANELLWFALKNLSKLAPGALFRLILAREPKARSLEEIDIVYEELQHLKALSHLSTSVKKQLAACIRLEYFKRANTVVFNQGEHGHCWYIILRGSVNVVIVGKGVVCSLHQGDDFGKLALVNDAPRAATIVTSEPDCYLLRVDKNDFNIILRDVEANTVRLREHGQEVLVLQKVASAPAADQQQQPPQAQLQQQPQQQQQQLQQQQLQQTSNDSADQSVLKYMVMAGTAEKMLEHLLETRIDSRARICPLQLTAKGGAFQHDQVAGHIQYQGDNFLEDFILTHKIFMPTASLCNELLKHYQAARSSAQLDEQFLIAKKRRVVKFVRQWLLVAREHFFRQPQMHNFLTHLHQKVKVDAQQHSSLEAELKAVAQMLELQLEQELTGPAAASGPTTRWVLDAYANLLPIRRHSGQWHRDSDHFLEQLHARRFELKLSPLQEHDEIVFRVYRVDHAHATLKTRLDEQARQVKQLAAKKLQLADCQELVLVHLKSNGERLIVNELESGICTNLSVNGRLFVCPIDHIDAIAPLPDQDPFQEVYSSLGATGQDQQSSATGHQQQQQQSIGSLDQNSPAPSGGALSSHLLVCTPTSHADIRLQMSLAVQRLEEFSSRDVAYCLSQWAWSLLTNMHEFELICTVFGSHNFKQHNTANLNLFLRHFNELQYWVVTQICLSTSLSKRVQTLRKFIKIAAHCKELQNLNAFFAIIMGLSNMAVARLTQTWERLPNKLKRTFSQFEAQIDPSRNHRRYRLFLATLEPPVVPFMPLFLKDITFAHEGNRTHLDNGLINFEKMQMVAQSLRTIRTCKSRPMKLDPSVCKFKGSIRNIELFFRDLKIIDNQRTLTQLSHQLEHRKS